MQMPIRSEIGRHTRQMLLAARSAAPTEAVTLHESADAHLCGVASSDTFEAPRRVQPSQAMLEHRRYGRSPSNAAKLPPRNDDGIVYG